MVLKVGQEELIEVPQSLSGGSHAFREFEINEWLLGPLKLVYFMDLACWKKVVIFFYFFLNNEWK